MKEPRVISTKEAAEYCGLSVVSFRRFARRNRLKRIPGIYGYDRNSIDFLLDSLNPLAKKLKSEYSFTAEIAKVKPYEGITGRHKPRSASH